MKRNRRALPAIERFWKYVKIEPFTGCWIWTASLGPNGYGQMSKGRSGEGMMRAHRFAYLHYRGPIPDGYHLDHLCRVRACVNPWCLEIVTPKTNFLRGTHSTAVTVRTNTCMRGHSMEDAYIRKNGDRLCRTCTKKYQYERRRAA